MLYFNSCNDDGTEQTNLTFLVSTQPPSDVPSIQLHEATPHRCILRQCDLGQLQTFAGKGRQNALARGGSMWLKSS